MPSSYGYGTLFAKMATGDGQKDQQPMNGLPTFFMQFIDCVDYSAVTSDWRDGREWRATFTRTKDFRCVGVPLEEARRKQASFTNVMMALHRHYYDE